MLVLIKNFYKIGIMKFRKLVRVVVLLSMLGGCVTIADALSWAALMKVDQAMVTGKYTYKQGRSGYGLRQVMDALFGGIFLYSALELQAHHKPRRPDDLMFHWFSEDFNTTYRLHSSSVICDHLKSSSTCR
jgi:hypothetical protein